jgi:hypothetical protein
MMIKREMSNKTSKTLESVKKVVAKMEHTEITDLLQALEPMLKKAEYNARFAAWEVEYARATRVAESMKKLNREVA